MNSLLYRYLDMKRKLKMIRKGCLMNALRRRRNLRNFQMRKRKRNLQRDPLNPRQLSPMRPKMAKNNQLNQ